MQLPVSADSFDGQTLYSLDDGREAGDALPDCLLLAGFDPLMLGYEKKQSIFLPPEYLRGIFSLSGIVMPPVLPRRSSGRKRRFSFRRNKPPFSNGKNHAILFLSLIR